jgi:hypothetical protein
MSMVTPHVLCEQALCGTFSAKDTSKVETVRFVRETSTYRLNIPSAANPAAMAAIMRVFIVVSSASVVVSFR